jgi:hypothetical protein
MSTTASAIYSPVTQDDELISFEAAQQQLGLGPRGMQALIRARVLPQPIVPWAFFPEQKFFVKRALDIALANLPQ